MNLHAHVFDLWVLKNLRQIIDGRMGHVIRFELFHPVGARFFSKKFGEGFAQLVVIFPAVGPRVEARIFDQLWMIDGFA